VRSQTVMYALSYKHTEHDFGKLSNAQVTELRTILQKEVGPGARMVALWFDSRYVMSEGLGLQRL
jgi:hypothetical protein